MIKKLLLGGAAALTLAGAAQAADLPAPLPPPVIVPLFSWTGAYIGVNAGYAYSTSDTFRTRGQNAALQLNVTRDLRRPNVDVPLDGFIGGGQIGFNYQHNPGGLLVLGIEADAQYADLQRTVVENRTNLALNPNQLVNTYRSEIGFLGTVRGRIGAAFDRVLVFGTGGLAYGDVTNTVRFQTGAPVSYLGTRSQIETGYAVGGGVEYALPTDSFLNFFRSSAVTIKGEYLYYNLGARDLNVAVTSAAFPGPGYFTRLSNEGSIARGGINFKFGSY